jgi:hypothetical protein
MAGGVRIPPDDILGTGPLNDSGQLYIDAGTLDGSHPDILLQYSGGSFTPLEAAGRTGPAGVWPMDTFAAGPSPQSMNQQGNLAFAVTSPGSNPLGTFFWKAAAQTLAPIALKGMPAGGDLTFTVPGGTTPVINNHDQVALPCVVEDASGQAGPALFLRAADGTVQPVVLPGQTLLDGVANDGPFSPSIDDGGRVAFLAQRHGDSQFSAYVWQQGTLAPALIVGTKTPAGAVTSVSSVLLDHQDTGMLMTAGIGGSPNQGIYRLLNGQLTPLVTPGQGMPDGSQFATLPTLIAGQEGQIWNAAPISDGDAAGIRVFLATLQDGSTAAYLLHPDGTTALVLKSGMTTPLGQITQLGNPGGTAAGPNRTGQIALTVRIDNGPQTLLLLTPAAP